MSKVEGIQMTFDLENVSAAVQCCDNLFKDESDIKPDPYFK